MPHGHGEPGSRWSAPSPVMGSSLITSFFWSCFGAVLGKGWQVLGFIVDRDNGKENGNY